MAKKPTLKELQKQLEEANEALLRERADAANVRRRADEERASLASFFKASVIKELLPTLDNLERALKSQQDNAKQNGADDFQKGIATIYKQFLSSLEKLGVERVKTVGEHFDPNTMQAVTMEDGDGKHEIVSEELQSGYKLAEELIRPAMVRVKG